MRSLCLALVLCGSVFVAGGCALASETQVTYRRGELPPPIRTAVVPGRYSLYAGDALEPEHRVELARGDAYGFVKKPDDSIVAVARGEEYYMGGKLAEAWHWKARRDE